MWKYTVDCRCYYVGMNSYNVDNLDIKSLYCYLFGAL